jgi:hypothetical protein
MSMENAPLASLETSEQSALLSFWRYARGGDRLAVAAAQAFQRMMAISSSIFMPS